MDESYIVSGTFFGDEGKGSVVDFLSHQKGIKENLYRKCVSTYSHIVSGKQ